jgi:hypothetical protein
MVRLAPERQNHHWLGFDHVVRQGRALPQARLLPIVYRVLRKIYIQETKSMDKTKVAVFEEIRRNVAGIDLAWRADHAD